MSEKAAWWITGSVLLFVTYMLWSPPKASAQDAEMQLKISNGSSEREVFISDVEGEPITTVKCVYQAQGLALRWMANNVVGSWTILKLYCGPPRRNL